MKGSLFEATKKLIIDSYEPNVGKLRLWIDPCLTPSVKLATGIGYKQVYCYESSRYRHNDLTKAADKLQHLVQSMSCSCDVRSLQGRSDYDFIGSMRDIGGLDIFDSSLLPAAVFVGTDCVYSATEANLEMLLQVGYRFLISGCEESCQWKPMALSYGAQAECTPSPTWSCTVTGNTGITPYFFC